MQSTDEAYFIGQHLEQYHHATRNSADYYARGLALDPLDYRCNVALGNITLARADYAKALMYAENSLKRAHMLKSIVATGAINFLATIAALPLVDKVGRRRLMLIGAAGLSCIYLCMTIAYAMGVLGLPVLLLVLAAIAIYAVTLAPVTWVLLSEVFPNRIRGMAVSIGTFALWFACFLLTYTFPLLNAGLGASGSFGLYCIICALGFIFIYRNVPETKGVSLEELEKRMVKE